MSQATVGRALGAGFRAAAGESWMAVVGMGVTLVRGLLTAPALAFLSAVSWMTVAGALRRGGGMQEVVLSLAHAWGSPRARSILLGLWLAGLLLWGALRVLWVAGAMPLVAWRLSGQRGEAPAFASAAAWRFHRVLPAAVVALALGTLGDAFVVLAAIGVARVSLAAQGAGAPGALALVSAGGLVAALVLAAALSVAGDVAVARAAMAGEGPGRSVGGAFRALLRRPAALLAAMLGVWLATALAGGAVQGFLGALASGVRAGPRPLLLVPQVALAAIAALVAAGAELWRLGALGVLALGDQEERETRPRSFRNDSLGIRPPSQ